ncbi:MAG: hypothetical protein IJN00_07090, partial [Clostridia bacterium]|nr:hypothetical protein [Clostridia bacterium]
PVIAAVDEFLNSLLRSASPALKKQLLTFAGELADCALAGDFSVDDLMVILRDEDSVEAAGYLIAYLLEYPTANAAHDIKQFLSDVGLGDFNWIIDGVENLLDSDIAAWIVEQIADGGAWAVDAIPDWLYKKITGFFGIDLKKEDIVFVLQLVGATVDAKQQIEVVPDSGKDISLPSLGGTPACFSVYADTLRAAAEKLGEASFDLARSADAVTVQRKKTSLFLGVIRIRLGSIARKLDKQSTKARKMQNTLASGAELYETA